MVRGESSIRISGKTNHKKWNKRTTATWSASIVAEPSPFGLRLKVTGGAQPVVSQVEAEGDCLWDLVQIHSDYMPRSVDIMAVVDTLRETLEGTWDSIPSSLPLATLSFLSRPRLTPPLPPLSRIRRRLRCRLPLRRLSSRRLAPYKYQANSSPRPRRRCSWRPVPMRRALSPPLHSKCRASESTLRQ